MLVVQNCQTVLKLLHNCFSSTTRLVWPPKRVKQALLLWVSPGHFTLCKMHDIPFLGHERGQRTESAFDINRTRPASS